MMETASPFIGKKSSILLFYTLWISILFFTNELFPEVGLLLFLLLIPISIIYFIVHLMRFFNGNPAYFKCLGVHFICWIAILLLVKSDVLKLVYPTH